TLRGYSDIAGISEHRLQVEGWATLSAVCGRTRQETESGPGERRSQRSMHAAWGSQNLDGRLLQEDFSSSGTSDHSHRTQHAIPPDLHRWAASPLGSDPYLEWLFDSEVGRDTL